MKYQIMIGILFTLLAKRKVSASELAAKYDISVRTVYRYVEEMICANIPIDVARGASGGIYISDAFKLPKGLMTRDEYARAIEAMLTMEAQTGDAVLHSAIEKLSAQVKAERFDGALTGNILVDCGTWGDERRFSDKLALVSRAIEEREALFIDYVNREGVSSHRTVLPHLLVYKQNVWYAWAFCKNRNSFRLFKLGRMRTIVETGETFTQIPYRREDIPLSFWHDGEKTVDARFLIKTDSLPYAEDWLGIENIRSDGKDYIAEVTLPDDDLLVGRILSTGSGLVVLAPQELRERVKKEAENLSASYAN